MPEERGLLVCIPITADPLTASVEVGCSKCGALVWRSVPSLAQVDLDAVCFDCVPPDTMPKVRASDIVAMAERYGDDPLPILEGLRRQGLLDDTH